MKMLYFFNQLYGRNYFIKIHRFYLLNCFFYLKLCQGFGYLSLLSFSKIKAENFQLLLEILISNLNLFFTVAPVGWKDVKFFIKDYFRPNQLNFYGEKASYFDFYCMMYQNNFSFLYRKNFMKMFYSNFHFRLDPQ